MLYRVSSVYLTAPDTPERLGFPLVHPVRVNGLSQGKSSGGLDGFDSIYPGGFLALILLGHSSDGDESGRPRLH